ncbi:MAG: isoamylase early set domain-containing protein [Streptosporangiales bacterium]
MISWRERIIMNFLTVSRAMARLGYAAVRLPLAVLDDHVVARYWDERAPLRVGFERFLGAADEVAGWLLAGADVPAESVQAGAGQDAAGQAGGPAREQQASKVKIIFTLPGEVQASSVALCGEFNGWSAHDIRLERGGDGCWRAGVALEPGRTYRYWYLLDGERWENAWQADRYVPNPYGSTDSVVVVE